MNSKKGKLSYDPEADLLSWELSPKGKIVRGKKIGNVIIHFTEKNVPILLEILEAKKFATQTTDLLKNPEAVIRSAQA